MRWIHLVVIAVFALATLAFAVQNLEVVTMSLFHVRVRVPLALLTVVVYVLGAITGGSLFALLRKSYKGARVIGGAS